MIPRISSIFLVSAALLSSTVHAYDLPATDINHKPSENVQLLQKISAGVAELSQDASKGIALISISKIIKGRPYYEVDPFDFFFGPRYRQPDPSDPGKKQEAGVGSGFIVDLDKGYIVTNNHVVEGADEIDLKLSNGETYEAKVLGTDPRTDVAVVQIKDPKFNRKGLMQLPLGSSEKVRVGEFVIALGAPFGLEFSQSFGAVSAVARGNLNITAVGNFIQTDAAINPGNSGGPLLDMNGYVIGMNTAIFSRSGSSAGIGFAVPSDLVKTVALQLINKGKVAGGYLGVALGQELDEELGNAMNLPKGTKGALVGKIEKNTPAAKAGMESGDVIVEVNGKSIHSGQELSNAVGLMQPGTKVTVGYYRAGTLKKTDINLGTFPMAQNRVRGHGVPQGQDEGDDESRGGAPKGAFNDAGLKIEPLNKQKHADFIQQYGIESNRGLLVTDVDPNSKIRASGIRPGDVLLKANNVDLKSVKDFSSIYSQSSKILIQLERRGTFLFASLRK
ncbi:MAG: trypsin-like peptidase domain-containing protein [Chitinophagaceae bacterium]|nr:trypsin-like peptidase domain-containing protein [Oligoflexus sp.]